MGSCHKNYNFLDCNWFKKLLFSTNSVVKFTIGQFVITFNFFFFPKRFAHYTSSYIFIVDFVIEIITIIIVITN